MNYALHHFRKEARHLLPRWVWWLAALGLELAIHLEWVMPMTYNEGSAPHTLRYVLSTLLSYGAMFMVLAGCPEDQPARAGAFIATRPLPRLSYYLARLLVIMVMFALPMLLQEALYLGLSERPVGAVLSGALWKGLATLVNLGWLIPMLGLLSGWLEIGLAVVVVRACFYSCQAVLPMLLRHHELEREMVFLSPGLWLVFHTLVACAVVWLAIQHQRFGWSLLRRLTLGGLVVILVYSSLVVFLISRDQRDASDPQRARELAQTVQFSVPTALIERERRETQQHQPGTKFTGHIDSANVPPDVEVNARLLRSSVVFDGAASSAVALDIPAKPRAPGFYPQPILHFLPKGTVLMPRSSFNEHEIGTLAEQQVPAAGKAMRLEADFACDWFQWSAIADVPLQRGAVVSTPDSSLTVTDVVTGTASSNQPKPGEIRINFRHHLNPAGVASYLVIYSPERQLAWCAGELEGYSSGRAGGWERQLQGWLRPYVLAYDDNAPAADLTKLRLIVLQRRYLGSSSWAWHGESMPITQHSASYRGWYFYRGGMPLAADGVTALRARIATLPRPEPTASEVERNRFILDVLRAYHAIIAYNDAHIRQQIDDVLAALRPLAAQRIDTFLTLPTSAVRDLKSPVYALAKEFTTDAQRDYVVQHLVERDWLAALAKDKGWGDYARQTMLPTILAQPSYAEHLRSLMLTWDDPAVLRRQLADLRYFPEARTFEKLYLQPELRPELDRLAAQLCAEVMPVIGWEKHACQRLEIAMGQGNADALDIALHMAPLGRHDDMSNDTTETRWLAQGLAKETGQHIPNIGDRSLYKQFRGQRVADFQYQPEKRGWVKQP